jgi:hypothetical protein
MNMANRVKLRVMGLTYSQTQTGSYALVLAEEEGKKRIPIMIGAFEAQAIALHLEDLQPPRPLTHDLFRNFAEAYGVNLQEVFINKLEEGIFYSELVFVKDQNIVRIDSRTSDAVALALRFQCPIFTTQEIIAKAGIVLEDKETGEEIENIAIPGEDDNLQTMTRDELELMLDEAVTNEDYESASLIRDEIKRREDEMK